MLSRVWRRVRSFLFRFPAIVAVFVFVVASMWCNFEFGMRFGIYLAIAMAAADFLKGFLYVQVSNAWSSSSYILMVCSLIGGVLLSAFSFTSAIGSIGSLRQEQSSTITKSNTQFTLNKTEVDRIRGELGRLPDPATLRTQADEILSQDSPYRKGTKVRDHVNNCDDSAKPGPHVQKYCGMVKDLRSQAADAESRRTRLETELAKASEVVVTVGDTKTADPQADIMVKLFPTLKDTDHSALFLVIFAALVIELVSSLGWWLVQPRKTPPKSRIDLALGKPQTSLWSRLIRTDTKAPPKRAAAPKKRKASAPKVSGRLPVLAYRDGELTPEFIALARNDNEPNSPTSPPPAQVAVG